MKRVFVSEGEENEGALEPQLKKQKPLVCAMREAMGVQRMQENLPKLEPFLRRVVEEEVGNVFNRFILHTGSRPPINRIEAAVCKQYQLHFENSLPHTLFTGSKIEAVGRVPLQISIHDTETNKKISSGPFSLAKIEILVIDGDFGGDDQLEWTEKEFSDSVVREREGKRPLLTGELVITLNNGVGFLGDVSFTDNSSWIRSRKFRLGARVIQSRSTEASVQEAISGAFFVKDHRGELYKKHHPPALDDEVWRLEKIGKDGAFHRRLADNGINTVQEFLKSLVMDQERLRTLLGSGMSNKIWEATLEHAKECVLDDKYYSYSNGQGVVLLFNSIFQLIGAMLGHNYHPVDDLDASQKVLVNKLKQLAYKNSEGIIELKLPENETLSASDAISLPQASYLEPHNPDLPTPHQDESAAQVITSRQPSTPCNKLSDPLQVKDYITAQCLGPLHANSFNIRDFQDVHLGDQLLGYNSEVDFPNSFSPVPLWDFHASGAETSGGLVPCATSIIGSPISSDKWVKLVAALKWRAVSKHTTTSRKDGILDLGYMNNTLGEWFGGEG